MSTNIKLFFISSCRYDIVSSWAFHQRLGLHPRPNPLSDWSVCSFCLSLVGHLMITLMFTFIGFSSVKSLIFIDWFSCVCLALCQRLDYESRLNNQTVIVVVNKWAKRPAVQSIHQLLNSLNHCVFWETKIWVIFMFYLNQLILVAVCTRLWITSRFLFEQK